MNTLLIIILASIIVSLTSLVGIFFFMFRKKDIQKYTILFVALAAGTLLGAAFLHLIPESFELFANHMHTSTAHSHPILNPGLFILFGILLFYFIEKYVHWHHHHDIDCHNHPLTTLSLIGDGFHNAIDGGLIAVAFMADFKLGIITTISIILHEIPQELGDFAILIHGGFSRTKALLWNFASALTSILGAIFTYFFLIHFQNVMPLLLAFTAGGFIYIALADIIPELNLKKHKINHNKITYLFLFGIIITYLMGLLIH